MAGLGGTGDACGKVWRAVLDSLTAMQCTQFAGDELNKLAAFVPAELKVGTELVWRLCASKTGTLAFYACGALPVVGMQVGTTIWRTPAHSPCCGEAIQQHDITRTFCSPARTSRYHRDSAAKQMPPPHARAFAYGRSGTHDASADSLWQFTARPRCVGCPGVKLWEPKQAARNVQCHHY